MSDRVELAREIAARTKPRFIAILPMLLSTDPAIQEQNHRRTGVCPLGMDAFTRAQYEWDMVYRAALTFAASLRQRRTFVQ